MCDVTEEAWAEYEEWLAAAKARIRANSRPPAAGGLAVEGTVPPLEDVTA